MSLENSTQNNNLEVQEENVETRTESSGNIPPDDQEKLAKIFLSNNEQKQVLVRQYTESKSLLNELKEQLDINNVNELKDRILEREKDVSNLQSRINGFDQTNNQIFGQLSQEAKDKYLRA